MKPLTINNHLPKILLAGALSTGLLLTSCKKYTELNPSSALSETTAFTTAANVELVANGVYEQAAVGTYSSSTGRGYPFGAASIEQSEMRGEDMVNLATFYQITYQATYNTTSANNVNMWEQLYALINQANVLINGVKGAASSGVITDSAALVYEGEGRFLRALAHHELLLHFCQPYLLNSGTEMGVPYRDTVINTVAATQQYLTAGRGTVAEDYTKILADLDWAEANLPQTRDNGGYSRATKGAAIALKTRIKLHMQDWDGVITEGAKLGTSAGSAPFTSSVGGYALTSDPATPFTSYADNTESIFSIANSGVSNGGVNGALAAMLGPGDLGGRGLVALSPNLFNASFWVDGDLRRTELTYQQTTDKAKYYFTYKYTDYTTRADWAPIMRYAEVLLNVAEAYAREGQTANAFALLNAVRNRSVPTSAQYTSAPSDLIQTILNERRVEFAAEGRRWPDLHRLAYDATYGGNGIPGKILLSQLSGDGSSYDIVNRPVLTPGFAAIVRTDYRFLWPIPTSETNNNPTLAAEQNPGY